MKIWQLFIILRHHVTILVTVFPNPTKLTNDLKQTYKPHSLVGPTVTRPVQDPLVVARLESRLYINGVLYVQSSNCGQKNFYQLVDKTSYLETFQGSCQMAVKNLIFKGDFTYML